MFETQCTQVRQATVRQFEDSHDVWGAGQIMCVTAGKRGWERFKAAAGQSWGTVCAVSEEFPYTGAVYRKHRDLEVLSARSIRTARCKARWAHMRTKWVFGPKRRRARGTLGLYTIS